MILLDQARLMVGISQLVRQDPDLAAILANFGPPPLWDRPPGFASLVLIILEQQVSLASARAAFDRLNRRVEALTPPALLALDDEALKKIGFSRQKAGYARSLAEAIQHGVVSIDGLSDLPDDAVRDQLVRLKGFGPWSADIYLLMAMLRPDVWPRGDLALAVAVREVKRLPESLDRPEFEQLGSAYAPYPSVAARLYWWHYLNTPRPRKNRVISAPVTEFCVSDTAVIPPALREKP